MLAFFSSTERGASDRILGAVAAGLRRGGLRLAGAVQVNVERPGAARCDMELHVLTGADTITISQDLGHGSRGCRLDVDGLERAAGLVAAGLEGGADLLIVNKFGKQECDGRGFRPLIGEALARSIPVLTAVAASNRSTFLAFSDGLAEELPADTDALLAWAAAQGSVRVSNPPRLGY